MTVTDIESLLLARVDAKFAAGQRRFFQHEVDTYGVRSPRVKEVSRAVYAKVRSWPPARRNRLLTELWKTGKLEARILACYVCRRFARQCDEGEFRLFERWIDRYVGNWAECDAVSSALVAASLANRPDLAPELFAWTESKNRWKQRAAAVSLVPAASKGRLFHVALGVASPLLDVRDGMVEKGVGWLLKVAYPPHPKETMAFLLANRHRATRLTLRYAAEKMTKTDRRRLLAQPRKSAH